MLKRDIGEEMIAAALTLSGRRRNNEEIVDRLCIWRTVKGNIGSASRTKFGNLYQVVGSWRSYR